MVTPAPARPARAGDAPARARHRRAAALTASALLAVAVVGAVAATAFPHGLLMLAFVMLAAPLAWHGVLRRGATRWTTLATGALLIAGRWR